MTNEANSDSGQMKKAVLLGIGTALGCGLVFGLLSYITFFIGLVGSFGAGIFVAAAMFSPYKQVNRALAKKFTPIVIVLALVATVMIIIIPFIMTIMFKSSSGGGNDFGKVLELSWVFFVLSLPKFGSTTFTAIAGLLGGIFGVPGRVNGLIRQGTFVEEENGTSGG